jgi:hypothetical protein
MTKFELMTEIKRLIEPDTTPNPEEYSDGEILDMIYDLVKEENENA